MWERLGLGLQTASIFAVYFLSVVVCSSWMSLVLPSQSSDHIEEFHQLQPLEAGTGYYVCAASRNVAGLGAFGPISDQMHTKKDRPMPIKKVEYIAFDHESITLRWDRPHCQGSSIIRYIIRCARTQDGLCSDSCPEYGLLVEQVENEDHRAPNRNQMSRMLCFESGKYT